MRQFQLSRDTKTVLALQFTAKQGTQTNAGRVNMKRLLGITLTAALLIILARPETKASPAPANPKPMPLPQHRRLVIETKQPRRAGLTGS